MVSKAFLYASAGGAVGAAQALGTRLLDSQLATAYLKNPSTAFNPKIIKPLKGFGTAGNLLNLGLSVVELAGGYYYDKRGRMDLSMFLGTVGGAGLVGYFINGAMPAEAVQNVIAADPSNPVGVPGGRISRPIIKSSPSAVPVSGVATF